MGGSSSKNTAQLESINRDVQSIRNSTRRSKSLSKENKDALVEQLTRKGNEASSLRKKKVKPKKIEDTMKLISTTVNEVLAKESDDGTLDKAAVESNSFVNVPVKKNGTVERELQEDHKKFKGIEGLNVNRRSVAAKTSLLDIEEKIKTLKPQINSAVENQDKQSLRFHKETIKVLATDLELIPSASALIEDKKNKLQSQLSSSYQKIDKAIREISRNSNLDYLKKNEQKTKIRYTLDNMEKEIQQIQNNLGINDLNSINALKSSVSTLIVKLKGIDESEKEFRERKLELTQRINQISNRLDENYQDVVKNVVINASEHAKKVKIDDPSCSDQLRNIKNYVNKLDVSNEDTQKLRSSLINFIDLTLEDVNKNVQKAKEDQSKSTDLKTRNKEEEKRKSANKIDNLLEVWNEFKRSTSYSEDDLAKLENVQKDIQKCINQKRKSIGAIIENQYMPPSTKEMAKSTPNLYSEEFQKNKKVIDELDQPQKFTFKLTEINPKHQLKSPKDLSSKEEMMVSNDIKNIKENFDKLKEDLSSGFQHNKEIYDEVQSYVERLSKYQNHPNENIANSAKSIIQEIHESYTDSLKISMPGRASINRNSIEMSLMKITEIGSFVEALRPEVINLTNDMKKLEELTESLNKCLVQLKDVKVATKYTMIYQTKEETIKLINEYLTILDKKKQNEDLRKLSQMQTENDEVLRRFNYQYQNFYDKVHKYSGTSKDIAYSKLKYNLNKLRNDVQDKIYNEKNKKVMTDQVDELIKILEQRVKKSQTYNFTMEKEKDKIETPLVNLPVIGLGEKNNDIVAKLSNDIKNLKERLNAFNGTYKDIQYNKLEFTLCKLVNDIQDKVPDQSTRNQMVEELGKLWDVLDEKTKFAKHRFTYQEQNQNQNQDKNQFGKRNTYALGEASLKKDEKQQVQSEISTLKERVNRFVGTYGDLLYNQIENGLHKLLVSIPERITDQKSCKELQEDVGKLIKILEQKSSKPQSFRSSSENVIQNPNQSNGVDLNRKKEEEKPNDLFNALNTFCSSSDPPQKELSDEESRITKSIERMEKNIVDLKSEIDSFVGSTNSKEYEELDTFLINIQLEIDKIQVDPKYKVLYKRKLKLVSQLNECGNILDDRAEECEMLEKLESRMNELCSIIDYNLSSLKEKELEQVDEDLIALQLDVGKLHVNEELMGRKNFCQRKINDYIKIVRQEKDLRIGANETFV